MKNERLFWGILFILGGIFLIVSKLGFLSDINAFSLLVSVFLVAIIIKSIMKLNFAGILFPLAFLGIIYDDVLGITSITPWTLLFAALLGTIGLSMIFHKYTSGFHKKYSMKFDEYEKIDIEDESHVRQETNFGSSIKYVNSNKFVQADLECNFGAMKVYFDNAVMEGESAIVNLEASFSGVEIYVPRSWRVEERTDVAFGGIDYKNRNDSVTEKTLILVGDISFSGVEIIYI